MKSISKFTLFSFFLAAFFFIAQGQTSVEKSSDVLTENKITGAWRVNYAESDNPLLKMQAFLQNKLASSASEKNTNAKDDALPTMSVSLVPPETLILAGDDNKSITINEGFSEIVFTRTFIADGKPRNGELQNGTAFSITATQGENSLKVETVSPRGNKMSEIYAPADEGNKLIVTVRFATAQSKEMLTLRRVYDRALLICAGNSSNFRQTAGGRTICEDSRFSRKARLFPPG